MQAQNNGVSFSKGVVRGADFPQGSSPWKNTVYVKGRKGRSKEGIGVKRIEVTLLLGMRRERKRHRFGQRSTMSRRFCCGHRVRSRPTPRIVHKGRPDMIVHVSRQSCLTPTRLDETVVLCLTSLVNGRVLCPPVLCAAGALGHGAKGGHRQAVAQLVW